MQQYPQYQPQPGYGAPPGGYVAPPPQVGNNYGQPPQQPKPQLSPGMNPFHGLKRGGQQTPVKEFIGTLVACNIGTNSFGDPSVDLSFDRVQVIQSDSPYPYPTLALSIKYSDTIGSGWGKFSESVAKAMGIDLEGLPWPIPPGVYHLFRHDDVVFFTRTNGEIIKGTVWEMLELLQPGQQPMPSPQIATQPPQQPQVPQQPQQVPIQPPMQPQMPQQPQPQAPTPAPQAPVPQATPGSPDPVQRALEFLHGKDMAKFFQEALPDPVIRSDQNLLSAIFNNTFVQAKIATGEVIQNPDGTHTVVGM